MGTIGSEVCLQKKLTNLALYNVKSKIEPGYKVQIHRDTGTNYITHYPVIRVYAKEFFIVINDRDVRFSLIQAIQASSYHMILNPERRAHAPSKLLSQFALIMRSTKPDKKRIILIVHVTEILQYTDPQTLTPEAETSCGH